MKALLLVVLVGFAALSGGCTTPRYSRSVTHHYDADGALTGTDVTERVEQSDAKTKPLIDVLEDQDYQK